MSADSREEDTSYALERMRQLRADRDQAIRDRDAHAREVDSLRSRVAELEREREELMRTSTPRGTLISSRAMGALLAEAEAGGGQQFMESVQSLLKRHGRIL